MSSSKENWLTWPVFSEITEVPHLLLNVFWFIFGVAITKYAFGPVDWVNVILYYLTLNLFFCAVNVLDAYCDYNHAHDRQTFTKKVSIIGRENLPLAGVKKLYLFLFLISFIPGIWLVIRTNWIVLILGIIGYAIGIFYTAGHRPINSTPFSSIIVTLSIAYFKQLICVYVSVFKTQPLNWHMIWLIFLLCLPTIFIFFLMQLGNDACDLKFDKRNNRHTLAYFIGINNSMKIIKLCVVLGPLWTLVNTFILHIAPNITALSALTLPIIWHGMQPFFKNPDKNKTFMLVFKNIYIFFLAYIILFALATWFPFLN